MHTFAFGPFRLEPAERRLLQHGEAIALTPKAFDTLVALVERAGHVVPKDELMRRVWPDAVVEEGTLAQNISTLRRVLGDDARYIETVPKTGYRFIEPVIRADTVAAAPAPSPASPHWWYLAPVAIVAIVAAANVYPRFRAPVDPDSTAPQSPTISPAARDAYERGRFFWNKRTADGLRKGLEYFGQAVALEPDFARAYSGIANTYVLMNFYGGSPDGNVWPRAKAAAERALALDSGLAEAHAALAHVKYSFEWDWPGAEREFKRALEIDGNDATAHQWFAEYLSLLGRTAEATREIERALELDPQSVIINAEQGVPYAQARQCARAEGLFLKALEMEPDFPATQYYLARCYQQDGRNDEAIALYQKLESKFGKSPVFTGSLAHAYAVSGRRQESRRLLASMETAAQSHAGWHYMIATVYAGLGEEDRAFGWLERAVVARDDQLVLLKTDTHLDPLRNDKRFAAVIGRVGIP